MHSPNAAGYSPEAEHYNPEEFMPIEHMRHLVGDTLLRSGRVDEAGVVQPVPFNRFRISDGFERLEPTVRNDIFIPSAKDKANKFVTLHDGTEIAYQLDEPSIAHSFYKSLTNSREGELGIDEIEYVAQSTQLFEDVIDRSIDYDRQFTTAQGIPTYFVRSKTPPPEEIEATRVYIPGGIDAMAIAAGVVSKGADFDLAKMWLPEMRATKQTLRDDTPIFQVSSIAQLESVVGALRELKAEGRLPDYPEPAVGYEVPGLPGVFIGQCDSHASFNRRMKELFVPAIEEAAQEFELGAGDTVTEEILTELSDKTRRLAMRDASYTNTHPEHHAFMDDQPVDEIIAAVAA